MRRRRNWVRRAGLVFAFALLACERPSGELTVLEQDMPVQPEVTTEATEAMRAAPARSSGLSEGACATQDDCAADEVCVAVSPRQAECVLASDVPELRPAPRGPLGQPAPPIGLLDGQAMRDHAARSRP
jgi:hypothetical protein